MTGGCQEARLVLRARKWRRGIYGPGPSWVSLRAIRRGSYPAAVTTSALACWQEGVEKVEEGVALGQGRRRSTGGRCLLHPPPPRGQWAVDLTPARPAVYHQAIPVQRRSHSVIQGRKMLLTMKFVPAHNLHPPCATSFLSPPHHRPSSPLSPGHLEGVSVGHRGRSPLSPGHLEGVSVGHRGRLQPGLRQKAALDSGPRMMAQRPTTER